MMTAGGLLLAARAAAQSKLLPLNSSGLDHLSITLPDSAAAATFYGKVFGPQVFHERMGVQRYCVRLVLRIWRLGLRRTRPRISTISRQE
jgi:hypothetical protein